MILILSHAWALDDEHAKLWSPCGIAPLGFAEMLAWLERHAQVVLDRDVPRAADDRHDQPRLRRP